MLRTVTQRAVFGMVLLAGVVVVLMMVVDGFLPPIIPMLRDLYAPAPAPVTNTVTTLMLSSGWCVAAYFWWRGTPAGQRERPTMPHVGQTAQDFMAAASDETRDANAAIIAQLAAKGYGVPQAFIDTVQAGTAHPAATRDIAEERRARIRSMLADTPEGMSADDLATACRIPRPTVYRLLKRLEQAGVVRWHNKMVLLVKK